MVDLTVVWKVVQMADMKADQWAGLMVVQMAAQ